MTKNLNDRINRLEERVFAQERNPFFIGLSTQELKHGTDGFELVKRTPESDFGGIINLIRANMSEGVEPEQPVQPNANQPFWRRRNGFIEFFEPLKTGEDEEN